jgi:prefoldin alpha subunit
MEHGANEELMMKASFLERHSQELAEKIDYLSQQLSELEEFRSNLDALSKSKENKMLASIGKGVYVKSSLEDKKLFVNVGSGVLVKKTPEETKEIIEAQIKQFHEAKSRLMAQMEIYNGMLARTMSEIEHSHKH